MSPRRGCFLASVALLVPAAAASAADWTRIPAAGADLHFYDRSKVVIQGDEITYWRKVAFAKPPRTRLGTARSALHQERIQCRDHTLRSLGWQLFAEEGVLLESATTPEAEAAPIVPETIGDRFQAAMCDLVETRRRREAELQREETQLAARRREMDQVKREIERLEDAVRSLRIELQGPIPAPAGAADDDPNRTAR